MDSDTYWQKQTDKPLFEDILWNRPEQKRLAGKLAIAGGNKNGFVAVAAAYTEALDAGAGDIRVVIPDALRRNIPPVITNTVFVPTNPAGSMSKDAEIQLFDTALWADGVLAIGDLGRNSETAILFENFLNKYHGQLTLTRDSIDLLKNNAKGFVDRPDTLLVCSFAQLQKIFQAVYYPKILSFSMQLTNLVETLHKFTITYPCTIAVLHNETMIVAHGGNITSTPWDNPLAIWRGNVAAKAAVYWLWSPGKPLEAVTTSLYKT